MTDNLKEVCFMKNLTFDYGIVIRLRDITRGKKCFGIKF